MKGTVLEQIVNDKRISLVARKKQEPLLSFADNLPLSDRDFIRLCAARKLRLFWSAKSLRRKGLSVRILISVKSPQPMRRMPQQSLY